MGWPALVNQVAHNIAQARTLRIEWHEVITVEVKNGFYGDDGTFSNGMFEGEKWDTIPLIKTYFVDDKNYCEGEIFK